MERGPAPLPASDQPAGPALQQLPVEGTRGTAPIMPPLAPPKPAWKQDTKQESKPESKQETKPAGENTGAGEGEPNKS